MFPLIAVLIGAALLYLWITGWWFAGLLVWLLLDLGAYFAAFGGPNGYTPWGTMLLLAAPAFLPTMIRHYILQGRLEHGRLRLQ